MKLCVYINKKLWYYLGFKNFVNVFQCENLVYVYGLFQKWKVYNFYSILLIYINIGLFVIFRREIMVFGQLWFIQIF